MEHSFKRRKNFIHTVDTNKYGSLEIISNKSYDFIGRVYALKIDTLESVGWPDPYPYPLP